MTIRKRLGVSLIVLATGAAAACGGPLHTSVPQVSTSDVHNFVAAYGQMVPGDSACKALQGYLDHASPGLTAYSRKYHVGRRELCAAVRRSPPRYEGIGAMVAPLDSAGAQIPALFARLASLYPEGRPPDVYFVVGNGISGGTFTHGRHPMLLISMEGKRSLDGLASAIAHEMAHTQQHYPLWGSLTGGPRFLRGTLLRQSIMEGSANFIAELLTGRANRDQYGEEHEAELWAAFQRDLHSKDYGRWLWNGQNTRARGAWPPDLAYFIGYRITQAYYARAANKSQALHDILNIRDFDSFLAASGYGGPQVPARPQRRGA